MNCKISSVRSLKSTDNLLIITNNNNLKETSEFLAENESAVLKNLFTNGARYAVFNRGNAVVVVLGLPSTKAPNNRKEKARKEGCDLLDVFKNYFISEITILDHSKERLALDVAEGIALGNYKFVKYYKDPSKKAGPLKKLKIHTSALKSAEVKYLAIVVEATCKARDLINEPLSYLTAVQLSKEYKKIGKEAGLKVEVFDKKKIQSLKMGGLLAVNKGSFDPPTFSIIEWKPAKAKNKKPIILVGKGVVYDTGGLSLKPTANSMDFMKSDMGGAAVIGGTMLGVAKCKLPLHIIGLVPSTDNRPGNNAYVPGDVIKMYSGSTVEVLNTDAEGRMLLADALHFAKKFKPELVIDFATLTGSAARAVGPHGFVMMGNADDAIKAKVKESGFRVHERMVELPMWEEYGEMLKSDIADMKNIGGSYAGAITAGKFLEHFTDFPWLHFDIAGSAFLQQQDSYRGKNGTGVGVRLMLDFLSNY